MTSTKPFIPKDKPKSWVVFTISTLAALLIAAPIAVAGIYLQLKPLESFGIILIVLCMLISIPSWLVFMTGILKGKYRNLGEQNWGEQPW